MGTVYSFISGIFNAVSKPQNIVIVGLDGAGKTMVLYCLQLGEAISNTVPTIGFNVEQLTHKKTKITCYDLGGQHRLRELWYHYMEDATGIIWVIDSSDKSRFEEAKDELHRIVQTKKDIPVLILANKQDMKDYAASPQEVHKALDVDKFYRDIHTVGCSALHNKRVALGLDWLMKHVE